jgi:hypothetical protein
MRIDASEMVIKNLVEGTVNRSFKMSTFCIEKPKESWGIELQKSDLQPVVKALCSNFDLPLIFAVLKNIKENQIAKLHDNQSVTWVHGVLTSFITIYNQDKFSYLKLAIL